MGTYTTSSAPLPYVEPYLQDYLGQASQYANTPYQQSPGTYTDPNKFLTSGWEAIKNRAIGGDPTMSAATGQLQKNINGDYLSPNSNPYLQQYVQQAQGDTVKAYNQVNVPAWAKTMQGSGSFGNTGVSEYAAQDASNLQRNLGQLANTAYMGAYNSDRDRQMSAIGQAPQFAQQGYTDANNLINAGQQMQTFNQAAQNQNQQWWQDAQDYPAKRLGFYGQALGMGGQGGTQTQQTPDPSMISQLFGGAIVGSQLGNLFGGLLGP